MPRRGARRVWIPCGRCAQSRSRSAAPRSGESALRASWDSLTAFARASRSLRSFLGVGAARVRRWAAERSERSVPSEPRELAVPSERSDAGPSRASGAMRGVPANEVSGLSAAETLAPAALRRVSGPGCAMRALLRAPRAARVETPSARDRDRRSPCPEPLSLRHDVPPRTS